MDSKIEVLLSEEKTLESKAEVVSEELSLAELDMVGGGLALVNFA